MLAALGSTLIIAQALAAEFRSFVAEDGTRIDYAVVLPEGYEAARSYPVMLAFPPGPQTQSMVRAGLQYWEEEGARRGYVVVSPVAPRQALFFQGGFRYVPEILAEIANQFNVEGGKLHLTGISNGGISAFHAAIEFPEKVETLTVLPGYPLIDIRALERIKDVPLIMFAGENDRTWISRMNETANEMRRLGGDVHYEIVPGEGHAIQSLTGRNSARIFDLIEEKS